MKQRIVYTLLAVVAIGLTACEIHTSNNGDLDGFWQLSQVDTLANNRSGDVRQRGVFWCVQADLLEMKDLHDMTANEELPHVSVFFRFKHEQGKLRLWEPLADLRDESQEEPDSVVTSVSTIAFYGLSRLDETFDVLRLDADCMTLASEKFRLHFRKY